MMTKAAVMMTKVTVMMMKVLNYFGATPRVLTRPFRSHNAGILATQPGNADSSVLRAPVVFMLQI